MTHVEAFRERQAAIEAHRVTLRAWVKILHLPASDPERRAAFKAMRDAERREREACAAYQVALDTYA